MRARHTADSSLLDDLMVLVDVYFDIVVDLHPINRAQPDLAKGNSHTLMTYLSRQ